MLISHFIPNKLQLKTILNKDIIWFISRYKQKMLKIKLIITKNKFNIKNITV
jgi:hypothetical protein